MTKNLCGICFLLITAIVPIAPSAQAAEAPASAAARGATQKIVAAAQAFVGTLDANQSAKALFAFNDKAQRVKWSNLPSGIFVRAGLRLGDLSQTQRDAAMKLLAATLSESGYQKVVQIMEADQVLKTTGGGPGRVAFGSDEFYISILGKPSPTDPWMLQFGGHHLALNVTIIGEHGVLTPSLTAAQPAIYTLNGKTVRPLGNENDKAFALINALDSAQQAKAILGAEFRDLVLGPGQDGKTILPEGIPASQLTEKQQALLLDLTREWVGIIREDAAAAKMAEVKANVSDTWFAWSGPTKNGKAAYFRVQGPTVFIEYAPQNLGGDATRHIHTIYRDPTNDYGKKFATP